MARIKNPLLSLKAIGKLGNITFRRSRKIDVAEKIPVVPDAKSPGQLAWRHMYQKCAALWHTLSPTEKREWETLARAKHMTGFAYWQSQCLRPNPGIYLPLQGGTMQGIINMAGYKIEALLDPVAVQDADTKAARDAAIAAAIGGSLDCDIHGYDGANWQKLLVESAAQHNLRVRLYGGANVVQVGTASISVETNQYAIATKAILHAFDPNLSDFRYVRMVTPGDDLAVQKGIYTVGFLFGFNGSEWDRLRTYGTGILKVGRAAVGLLTTRMAAAGQVGTAAPHKLFWMLLNPAAGNSVFELTDAIAGGAAIKVDHFDTARDGHMITFDPPVEFLTGLWLETFTNMTSVTFGYI